MIRPCDNSRKEAESTCIQDRCRSHRADPGKHGTFQPLSNQRWARAYNRTTSNTGLLLQSCCDSCQVFRPLSDLKWARVYNQMLVVVSKNKAIACRRKTSTNNTTVEGKRHKHTHNHTHACARAQIRMRTSCMSPYSE